MSVVAVRHRIKQGTDFGGHPAATSPGGPDEHHRHQPHRSYDSSLRRQGAPWPTAADPSRSRAVVIAFGVIVVLALGMFLGAGSVASRFAGPTETTVIKVEPGQTLWGIAAEVTDSGDDVRDTMYDIQRMNAMTSSTLQAGQKLRVPLAD
jgi:Tfp pilus assembly protein FimV